MANDDDQIPDPVFKKALKMLHAINKVSSEKWTNKHYQNKQK
ncbi:9107_t:CDS:2 [Gigaspora margarita]|uniref:9107_t:CDS:1 n=1 Tax=Gigaspora margarita TaxID=4874 RepID=A0ABM8W2D4_GIGMA|nr:9107_t:CDS:2 [Gigaspora margarita]